MPHEQMPRRTQREIRQGKAPRRLAERAVGAPKRQGRPRSTGAHSTRRLAFAAAVLLLVIASTVVHSDDYGNGGFSPPAVPTIDSTPSGPTAPITSR